MESYNNQYQPERELGWDDEITQDSKEFIILPDGDYEFRVEKVERARFNGSEKMPPCNKAIVSLSIKNDMGEVTLTHTLMLHSKVEWKLSEFFESLGMKKKGEPLRMNWNIIGISGKCKLGHKEYNGNTYNEVKKFYAKEIADTGAPQKPQYTPGRW